MTTHLEKQLEKITVKEGVAPRPGIGNLGQKVKLRANHLKISKVKIYFINLFLINFHVFFKLINYYYKKKQIYSSQI